MHDAGRGPVAQLRVGEQVEHEPHRRLERVDRLHVDVQVRAELARAHEQRAHAARRVVAADVGRLGPQQRAQRRHLHGQVHARQRPERVLLEHRAGRPGRRRGGERLERVHAALGVAVRLGGGDGRLAEQVERHGRAVLPEVADRLDRLARRLADDEAVRHVAHPAPRRPRRARRVPRACRTSSSPPRSAAGARRPRPGTRSDGARDRRASDRPASRPRSGTARPAARRPGRPAPSPSGRAHAADCASAWGTRRGSSGPHSEDPPPLTKS